MLQKDGEDEEAQGGCEVDGLCDGNLAFAVGARDQLGAESQIILRRDKDEGAQSDRKCATEGKILLRFLAVRVGEDVLGRIVAEQSRVERISLCLWVGFN